MLHWFDKVVFYSMIALDDLPADILHRIAEVCCFLSVLYPSSNPDMIS
jgi:hypothetical protein